MRVREGLGSRLGDAALAFSTNARNPSLRRAQLSFLGAWTAEWAFTVALGVVDLDGAEDQRTPGPEAVGVDAGAQPQSHRRDTWDGSRREKRVMVS